MSASPLPAAANETREERIEAIMKELRPKIEETVRRMVERAVDAPEAEEFGAIDFEFRDAGQKLVNEVRQAGVAASGREAVRGRDCGLVELAFAGGECRFLRLLPRGVSQGCPKGPGANIPKLERGKGLGRER